MGFAFIPVYVQYMGIEAYGLIGIFGILQAWLVLLDMGMTPALSREMARFTGGAQGATFVRDLLRSIEIIILGVAFIAVLGIWLASDWLVSDWIRLDKLDFDTVRNAICTMGFIAALKFFEGIYHGALMGLQRQVQFNIVNSGLATLRSLGAVGILMWIAPTIEAFFMWQALISIISVGVLAAVTYRSIPKVERSARFSMFTLSKISNFALGMMGITFLSLVLMQADKIILTRFLPLSEFGYYSLAATLAGALYMVVSPIVQAWFPRLTELHAEALQVSLIKKYHQGAQLVSVVMGTTALIVIVFSETILEVWTDNADLASQSAKLLSLLALGNLLNGLMWIPYQTQLAFGWTSLSMRINLISVAIIIPSLLLVVPRYGAEGAAWIWVGLNTGYVLIGIQFMFRKILITEKWNWYKEDVFIPISVATIVSSASAWAMPENLTHLHKIIWVLVVSFLTMILAAISSSMIRAFAIAQLRQFLKFL